MLLDRPGVGARSGSPSVVVRRRASGRPLGVLVLLAVLVLALAVPPLLRPGLPGQPAAVPLPVPPPVGSCIVIDARSVTLTPCSELHDAEVVAGWPAGDSVSGAPSFEEVAAAGTPGISSSACWDAQFRYLDYDGTDASGNWNPVKPNVQGELIAAPPGERAPTRGWTACVLKSPDGHPMAGSLRGGYDGFRPAESRLASCLRDRDPNDAAGWTNCAEPHRIEVLATFDPGSVVTPQGVFRGVAPDDQLLKSCRALVATVTASADLTFGGRARVGAESLLPGSITEISAVDAAGSRLRTYIPVPLCFVELLGDGELDGSVIGLNDQPLPLA